MGKSEILLNDIPGLGNGFIPLDFMWRQLRSPDSLGHDAVGDMIEMKDISVILFKVAFIGIDLLDRVLGMATAGNTKGKIRAVMMGGRCHFRGQSASRSRENFRMLPFLSRLPAAVFLFCFSSSSFSLLMG